MEECIVDPGHSERVETSFCPRTCLKKLLTRLETEKGLCFKFGHELEFFLVHQRKPGEPSNSPLQPFDYSNYAQSTALDHAADVLDDICDNLEHMGVAVEQYHAEGGPGQFEIVLECDECKSSKEHR